MMHDGLQATFRLFWTNKGIDWRASLASQVLKNDSNIIVVAKVAKRFLRFVLSAYGKYFSGSLMAKKLSSPDHRARQSVYAISLWYFESAHEDFYVYETNKAAVTLALQDFSFNRIFL